MKTLLKLYLLYIVTVAALILPTVILASTYCSPNATTKCVSNISYWYDSCGVLQSVNQNCNLTNQVCQNGACVNKTTTSTNSGYTQHFNKSCYNGDVHWYDSKGAVQDVYQKCSDNNSCTFDACTDTQCSNALKCDGSTCAIGSQDYQTYCASANQTQIQTQTQTNAIQNNQNNQNQYQNQNQNTQTQNTTIQGQVTSNGLAILLFGKNESNSTQWQKSLSASSGDKIDFLVTVKNISATPATSVIAIIDTTNSISYTGDLTVNGTPAVGNISAGISLGNMAPGASEVITFTGTMQASTNPTLQVNAKASSTTTSDSDYLSITTPQLGQTTASVTDGQATNSILDFLKRWYLWIIIIIILIVLFIIIFRRLSTSV